VFEEMALTERMRLGMLPSRAMTSRRLTASELPTTSATRLGRYFSTHGMLYVSAGAAGAAAEEEAAAMALG
jgi:hypothetical protein